MRRCWRERARCERSVGMTSELKVVSETGARPSFDWQKLDHVQLVEDLRNAVICATTMTFIQGLQLVQAASGDYEWSVSCEEAARVIAMSSVGRCGAVTL